jgi:hypothetical protein
MPRFSIPKKYGNQIKEILLSNIPKDIPTQDYCDLYQNLSYSLKNETAHDYIMHYIPTNPHENDPLLGWHLSLAILLVCKNCLSQDRLERLMFVADMEEHLQSQPLQQVLCVLKTNINDIPNVKNLQNIQFLAHKGVAVSHPAETSSQEAPVTTTHANLEPVLAQESQSTQANMETENIDDNTVSNDIDPFMILSSIAPKITDLKSKKAQEQATILKSLWDEQSNEIHQNDVITTGIQTIKNSTTRQSILTEPSPIASIMKSFKQGTVHDKIMTCIFLALLPNVIKKKYKKYVNMQNSSRTFNRQDRKLLDEIKMLVVNPVRLQHIDTESMPPQSSAIPEQAQQPQAAPTLLRTPTTPEPLRSIKPSEQFKARPRSYNEVNTQPAIFEHQRICRQEQNAEQFYEPTPQELPTPAPWL